VASSISRIKKINFFGPQEVSYRSLWTISEPNDAQTTAVAFVFMLASVLQLLAVKNAALPTSLCSVCDIARGVEQQQLHAGDA
jgi:hypothetical protein